MQYRIDRFEDEYAVLEDSKKQMLVINKNKLPKEAKEGDILEENGNNFKMLMEETNIRKAQIKERMSRLFEE